MRRFDSVFCLLLMLAAAVRPFAPVMVLPVARVTCGNGDTTSASFASSSFSLTRSAASPGCSSVSAVAAVASASSPAISFSTALTLCFPVTLALALACDLLPPRAGVAAMASFAGVCGTLPEAISVAPLSGEESGATAAAAVAADGVVDVDTRSSFLLSCTPAATLYFLCARFFTLLTSSSLTCRKAYSSLCSQWSDSAGYSSATRSSTSCSRASTRSNSTDWPPSLLGCMAAKEGRGTVW